MLVKELSNANRIDCNASIIISSTTTTTMKRKRDDSCISTSYHQDDDDDDDYILPLYKRYASSSNRLSAFGMSSYDIESRDGPATSSSTNGNDRSDDSNGVLDDETAALVSNFRTSILRGNPQTASRLEPPHTISPSTTTSLACSPYSLYDCYDDDADHDDAKGTTTTSSTYPDFPSIGRATTISDSSDVSSVESDPIDMSSRPTSPQEEILEEQHKDYHHCSSDYSPWSSSTELSSLEYTTDHCIEEVVEKDAIEEARERSSSIDRSSSSPPSSMAPARRQPSPLWSMSSSSTPAVAQVRGKQEEETSFWTANWNMFPQGSSQVS